MSSMNGVTFSGNYDTDNLTVNNISCNNISSNGIVTNTLTTSSIMNSGLLSTTNAIITTLTSTLITSTNFICDIINLTGKLTGTSALFSGILTCGTLVVTQFLNAKNISFTNSQGGNMTLTGGITCDGDLICSNIYYNSVKDPTDPTGTRYDAQTDLTKIIDNIRKDCLNAVTTGLNNQSCGNFNLAQVTTGDQNVAYGNDNLYSIVGGSYNTAVGSLCGLHVKGDHNTFIGFQTGAEPSSTKTYNRSTGIGFQANVSDDDQVVLGDLHSTTIINKLDVKDQAYFYKPPLCPFEPTTDDHLCNKSYVDEIKQYIDLTLKKRKHGFAPVTASGSHYVGFFEPFPLNTNITVICSIRYFYPDTGFKARVFVDEITSEGFTFVFNYDYVQNNIYTEVHWLAMID